jgi:DNA replication ATP-dependent helicase Dna2
VQKIEGSLAGVLPGAAGAPATLLLDGPAGALRLQLDEATGAALGGLAGRVAAHLAAEGAGRRLSLVAYHLAAAGGDTFVLGEESLLVLEPEWLINVSDLEKVEYCPRQYLIERFLPVSANVAMTRGNIVHAVFEQVVKTPGDEDAITEAARQSFFDQALSLARLGQSKNAMWREVKPHLERAKAWVRGAALPPRVRSECFMLAPSLGVKGKIDAVWSDATGMVLVGELKTGRSQGAAPKPGHALQARAYSLMALATGQADPARLEARILYTGNEPLARSLNLSRSVSLDAGGYREVMAKRNLLVLIDHLADAPFETRQPNKCRNCTRGRECEAITVLLGNEDPRGEALRDRFGAAAAYGPEERAWFRLYAGLQEREYRSVKRLHTALWRKDPRERCAEGTAAEIVACGRAGEQGAGCRYRFRTRNRSELREEDRVLVSDERGPMHGLLAQGTVTAVLEDGLVAAFDEPLEFEPRWVDRYVTEELSRRPLTGLTSWLAREPRQRDLVVRGRPPAFSGAALPRPSQPVGGKELNERQELALEQALRMEDYLLIQGPPGSGKTTLIAAVVRELVAQGQRVLLAAGTNTAVDTMFTVLVAAGLGERLLRLGAPGRVAPAVRGHHPLAIARDKDLDAHLGRIDAALRERAVVAATTSGILGGACDGLPPFDVVVVDEAAQVTLPASVGTVARGARFILIGDHCQLPAVVQSEEPGQSPPGGEAATQLSRSLFEELFVRAEREFPEAVVRLNRQYRMNEEICALPRALWYQDDFQPADERVGAARLTLKPRLTTRHRLAAVLAPDRPVVFVHVSWRAAAGGPPRTNEREAELVRELVGALTRHGVALGDIGVIAPFRAQVNTVRLALERDRPGEAGQVRQMTDTVDRFQGQEREVVILTLATHGEELHDLLRDERRLNVAITRARSKLVILGDREVLASHPAYRYIIDRCTVVPDPLAG